MQALRCTRGLPPALGQATSACLTAYLQAAPCMRRAGRARLQPTPLQSSERLARRSVSTSSRAKSGPQRLVYSPVPQRAVLSISGRDTFKFLQGLVSNNVLRLEKAAASAASEHSADEADKTLYAGLMNPQGRMLCDLFLHLSPSTSSSSPAILLEHDARVTAELTSFIRRFKLRSKVTLEDCSDAWRVSQAMADPLQQEGSSINALTAPAGQLPARPKGDESKVIIARDPRAPGMGFRVLSPSSYAGPPVELDRLSRPVSQGISIDAGDAYTVHRILQGVPEGPEDMALNAALPLEMNLDYMQGVDFRKGCYVGQELTARTHHTGVVRKRMLPIAFYDAAGPAPGTLHFDGNAVPTVSLPAVGSDVRSFPLSSSPAASSSTADEAASPASPRRGKAAGKLGSRIGNIGLACLRLEQVLRWSENDAGDAAADALTMRIAAGGADGHVDALLGVRPWIPAWWPEMPARQ